jgi:tetratricopeptide (TPR) repeat protein
LLRIKPNAAGYRGLLDMLRQAKHYGDIPSVIGESIEQLGVLGAMDMDLRPIAKDAAAMKEITASASGMLAKSPEKLSPNARLAVALLALEAERYKTAGEFFESALAVDPKLADEVYITWGVALVSADRSEEAVKVFERAIRAKPGDANPAFYFYLAGALALEKRYDDALKAARTSAEKRKTSARFRARPAWVLSMAKRRAEAKEEYEKLIAEFDGEHASAETREALHDARMVLSSICVDLGEPAKAEEWLEQVLDEYPDDTGAMNDLGYLWADLNKNLSIARRMIGEAVADKPDCAAYRDSLGWVLFRLGKFTEAVAELEKAAADKKADGTVFDHLGDVYAKTGRREKALEMWRKSADQFSKDGEKEKEQAVKKKISG